MTLALAMPVGPLTAHAAGGNAFGDAEEHSEAGALLQKKKWAEAAILLKKMIKASPDDVRLSLDLARALLYAGRREEALSVLSQAATLEKGSGRAAVIRRSRVFSRQFLTNATFQTYQEGLNLVISKRYGAAKESFERALLQEPDNVEILTRLGQCLVMLGDFDSAAERLRFARKLNPFEPEVRLWLGRALHQRGELNEAVEELKIAHQELPGSELAPVWYAEALSSAGQRAIAVTVLEQDVRGQPFHLLALVTLARLRYQGASRENSALWAVRKDLQVALSRFERYASGDLPKFEGELGLDLRLPEAVRTEIQSLLQRVDARLESQSKGT